MRTETPVTRGTVLRNCRPWGGEATDLVVENGVIVDRAPRLEAGDPQSGDPQSGDPRSCLLYTSDAADE